MLFITQPAVSNALARMRKAFDDPLVSTPAGMIPTPASENIIGRGSRGAATARLKYSCRGTLRPRHVGAYVPAQHDRPYGGAPFARAGGVLQRLAPGIRIESYFTTRKEVPEALASSAINLAIDRAAARRSIPRTGAAGSRPVCVHAASRPSVCQEKLTIDDYLGFGHIHVSSRRQGLGLVDVELNRLGPQTIDTDAGSALSGRAVDRDANRSRPYGAACAASAL